MRTLKIFVITAFLFLLAAPAVAANYPPEIQELITQALKSFVCETPSSLFIKVFINSESNVYIAGHTKKEMLITQTNRQNDTGNLIADNPVRVFLRTNDGWKKSSDLTKQEDEESETALQPFRNDAVLVALQSCVQSNLRNRGLLQ